MGVRAAAAPDAGSSSGTGSHTSSACRTIVPAPGQSLRPRMPPVRPALPSAQSLHPPPLFAP